MMEGTQTPNLSCLPEDVLCGIVSLCDTHDRVRSLPLVCRSINQAVNNPRSWAQIRQITLKDGDRSCRGNLALELPCVKVTSGCTVAEYQVLCDKTKIHEMALATKCRATTTHNTSPFYESQGDKQMSQVCVVHTHKVVPEQNVCLQEVSIKFLRLCTSVRTLCLPLQVYYNPTDCALVLSLLSKRVSLRRLNIVSDSVTWQRSLFLAYRGSVDRLQLYKGLLQLTSPGAPLDHVEVDSICLIDTTDRLIIYNQLTVFGRDKASDQNVFVPFRGPMTDNSQTTIQKYHVHIEPSPTHNLLTIQAAHRWRMSAQSMSWGINYKDFEYIDSSMFRTFLVECAKIQLQPALIKNVFLNDLSDGDSKQDTTLLQQIEPLFKGKRILNLEVCRSCWTDIRDVDVADPAKIPYVIRMINSLAEGCLLSLTLPFADVRDWVCELSAASLRSLKNLRITYKDVGFHPKAECDKILKDTKQVLRCCPELECLEVLTYYDLLVVPDSRAPVMKSLTDLVLTCWDHLLTRPQQTTFSAQYFGDMNYADFCHLKKFVDEEWSDYDEEFYAFREWKKGRANGEPTLGQLFLMDFADDWYRQLINWFPAPEYLVKCVGCAYALTLYIRCEASGRVLRLRFGSRHSVCHCEDMTSRDSHRTRCVMKQLPHDVQFNTNGPNIPKQEMRNEWGDYKFDNCVHECFHGISYHYYHY